MGFSPNFRSVEWAWRGARVIQLLHHDAGTDALRAFVMQTMGTGATIRLVPKTTLRPRMLVVRDNDDLLVFMDGCPGGECAARLVGGYYEHRHLRPDHGFNRTVASGASQVFTEIHAEMHPEPAGANFFGHSYGGAVAQCCAALLKQSSRDIYCTSFSYGSPRAGDVRALALLEPVNSVRYMIPGDPISLLPPKDYESMAMHYFLALDSLGNTAWFHHPRDGKILQTDRVDDSLGETIGVIPDHFGTRSMGWATGLLSAPVHEHHISSYEARLNAARMFQRDPELPQPLVQNPMGIREPAVLPVGSFLIPALNFFDQPTDAGPGPDGFPPTQDLPAGFSYTQRATRARRTGPYYSAKFQGRSYVHWRNQPLFGPYGARTARKIASRLNSVHARYLQSMHQNPSEFEASIAAEFTQVQGE